VGDRLAGTLSPAVYAQVMEAFARTTRERIDAMQDAAGRGDLGALAVVAHSAKGACGTFDAGGLAELARRVELRCEAGDVDGARVAVDAFAADFARRQATLFPEKGVG
jgi:HPt (histidine-containing phosphotransfer) domain-containing protein